MPVLEPAERDFVEVEHTGVAIQLTEHGYHSGIVYRLGDSPARIVHLAFHHIVQDEEAALPYRWANMGLDSENKIVLSYLASRVGGAGVPISYGFDGNGAIFDPDSGELSELPVGKGLTCATFMLAMLRTYGHELISVEGWPDRQEDAEWQAEILDLLEQHATPEHVEAVRSDIGAKRIRPTEVVGSATHNSDQWPVAFVDARYLADQVEADLAA